MRLRATNVERLASTVFDVLILGGRPIREPVFFHGPFVMNTREEILTAFEDYKAGRLGTIPASYLRR